MARKSEGNRLSTYQVPKQFREPFEAVATLADNDFNQISTLVSDAADGDQMTELTEAVVAALPDVESGTVDGMLEGLVTFQQMLHSSGTSVADGALMLSESPDLTLQPEQREILRKRLLELLNAARIRVVSKALTLSLDHERVYLDSKVITDIRPIFGTDDEPSVDGALVNHVLRMTYIDAAGVRTTISLALDSRDLVGLKSALDRAEKKEVAVRALLEAGGVALVGGAGS